MFIYSGNAPTNINRIEWNEMECRLTAFMRNFIRNYWIKLNKWTSRGEHIRTRQQQQHQATRHLYLEILDVVNVITWRKHCTLCMHGTVHIEPYGSHIGSIRFEYFEVHTLARETTLATALYPCTNIKLPSARGFICSMQIFKFSTGSAFRSTSHI